MAEEVTRAPTFTVLATKSHKKKDFQSGTSLELLPFKRKQVITVLDFDDTRDAIYGESEGKRGWFPASFVKVDADVAKALAALPPAGAEASSQAVQLQPANDDRMPARSMTTGSVSTAHNTGGAKLTFTTALRSIKSVDHRGIPVSVKAVVEYIRLTAMQEPDIFRSAGNGSEVAAIRKQIEEGEMALSSGVEIHSVAVALKLFLRDLNEPLLTYDLFPSFTAALKLDEDRRIEQFKYLVELLPPQNHNLCAYLALFWKDFVDKGHANGLTLSSAGRLFGQIFCRNNDFTIDQTELRLSYAVTEILIGHAEVLFPSTVDFTDKKVDRAREVLRKKEREMMQSHAKVERKARKKARKEKKTPSNETLSPVKANSSVHARRMSQDMTERSPKLEKHSPTSPQEGGTDGMLSRGHRRFSSTGLAAEASGGAKAAAPPKPAPLKPRQTRQRKSPREEASPPKKEQPQQQPREKATDVGEQLAAARRQLLLYKLSFIALLGLFIASHVGRTLI
mmetsp:Transcript_4310/g.15170  ORF Transcript_4310/g.15170 Transcript_4310/m.15170 type:complete len:508 (+) Transcript_4310:34-1557(+)